VANDIARLMKMGLQANLVGEDEAELHVDLVGTDEGRIIGKKGEVLLALQFVINRIISRGEDDGGEAVLHFVSLRGASAQTTGDVATTSEWLRKRAQLCW